MTPRGPSMRRGVEAGGVDRERDREREGVGEERERESSSKTTLVRVFSRDPIRGKLTNRGNLVTFESPALAGCFIQFRFRFLGIKGARWPPMLRARAEKTKEKRSAVQCDFTEPFVRFSSEFSLVFFLAVAAAMMILR